MASAKAIIGTEESLKLIVGPLNLEDGEWRKHSKSLWVHKLAPGKEIISADFPQDIETVVVCERVSLNYFILLYKVN